MAAARSTTRALFFDPAASASAVASASATAGAAAMTSPSSARTDPSSGSGPRHGGTEAWNDIPTRITAVDFPPVPPLRPADMNDDTRSAAPPPTAADPVRAFLLGCMRTTAVATRKRSTIAAFSRCRSPCA